MGIEICDPSGEAVNNRPMFINDSPSADAYDGNGKTLVECPVIRKFSSQNRNWFRFWSFPGKSLRKNAVQGIITV